MLKEEPDIQIIAVCHDGKDALQQIRALSPTVAILDLSMPEMDGLTVTAKLRHEGNQTPVLILTTFDDPLLAARARYCQVNAYILKNYAMNTLLETIREVASGARLLEKIETTLDESGMPELPSPREIQILKLIACGMNNNFIGDTLGISAKTVDNHRSKIMKKLKVHSTADLVRYAIKVGLA